MWVRAPLNCDFEANPLERKYEGLNVYVAHNHQNYFNYSPQYYSYDRARDRVYDMLARTCSERQPEH
jgi:hypothetical protein